MDYATLDRAEKLSSEIAYLGRWLENFKNEEEFHKHISNYGYGIYQDFSIPEELINEFRVKCCEFLASRLAEKAREFESL